MHIACISFVWFADDNRCFYTAEEFHFRDYISYLSIHCIYIDEIRIDSIFMVGSI